MERDWLQTLAFDLIKIRASATLARPQGAAEVMAMRTFCLIVACAALICAVGGSPARATDAPLAEAPAVNDTTAPATPSPRVLALTKRYFDAIHFKNNMEVALRAMLPQLINSMVEEHPDLTAEQRRVINQTLDESLPGLISSMIDKVAPIYASTFSEQELTDAIAFYESPSGKAIIDKAPSLAPKVAALLPQLMPEYKADLMRRLCRKIACPGSGPARTSS